MELNTQQISSGTQLVMSDKDFDFIRDIVYETAGIRLKDTKRTLVMNRLRKRLVTLGMSGFGEYVSLLKRREGLRAEMKELLDAITTNETYFFRESKHFDVLNQHVFPAAVEKGRALNIWSAACSTGQEPYSIAISALEYAAVKRCRLSVAILGTDICTTALDECREGFYHERKMKGVPPTLLTKYFEREGDGYRVVKEVKSMARFQQMNLMVDRPFQKFDVILCRNVLIYFDDVSQGKTIANLRESLHPDGLLFIGHAESLYRHSDGFEGERIANTVVYRKVDASKAAKAGGAAAKTVDLKKNTLTGVRENDWKPKVY